MSEENTNQPSPDLRGLIESHIVRHYPDAKLKDARTLSRVGTAEAWAAGDVPSKVAELMGNFMAPAKRAPDGRFAPAAPSAPPAPVVPPIAKSDTGAPVRGVGANGSPQRNIFDMSESEIVSMNLTPQQVHEALIRATSIPGRTNPYKAGRVGRSHDKAR